MNSDDKNIAARLRQLIQSQSNFQQGRLTSSAGTGGLVTAKLPDGTQVTATAGNDCSGGDCSLFRLEDGSYIAMSGNASQLVSQQITTYRKSTPPEDPDQGKYLKVLFSKVENTKRVFYIGGDRTTPVKIHEADATDVVKAAYISCTGEGKNKWVVALAIQKSTAITIWHITAKESEKKSWVDTKNEIYPLLTYNGFGMWSAGTFIAPTLDQTESSETTGETQITTTNYTVNRPSFVTGSGQVRDVNTAKSRTIKKAEVCYKTIMVSGACVPGPQVAASYTDTPSIPLGTFGDKGFWQMIKNYWDGWRAANPGNPNRPDPSENPVRRFLNHDTGVQQSWIDSMQPLESVPPLPPFSSPENPNGTSGSGYRSSSGYSATYSWNTGDVFWSLQTISVFFDAPGKTASAFKLGTPVTTTFMTAGPPSCDPPSPKSVVTPCPNQVYNDTVIPGQKTRTISGGYSLQTKSFLINNGEYKDLPGEVRLVAVGSGVASGTASIIMTTTFTYSYSGTNWLDRTAITPCQSQDVSVQVDVEPAELKSNETREVCLAVGINSGDRITFKYTQADNDRKEELYRNGVKLNAPTGFTLALKDGNPSYSSPAPFAVKSEYVGINKYPASPEYFVALSTLENCLVLTVKPPEFSFAPSSFTTTTGVIKGVTSGAAAVTGGKQSNFVTIKSLTIDTSSDSKNGTISGASMLAGSTTQGQPSTPSIMSLNSFTGLLALPEGYCNLDDPYTRSMSTMSNMIDNANKYQTYLLNVVRPLGTPTFCFYTDGKIMVSAFPNSNASYCYLKDKAAVIAGKFSDSGSFTWGKIETRDVHPLGKNRGDTSFVTHSTSAWFK